MKKKEWPDTVVVCMHHKCQFYDHERACCGLKNVVLREGVCVYKDAELSNVG